MFGEEFVERKKHVPFFGSGGSSEDLWTQIIRYWPWFVALDVGAAGAMKHLQLQTCLFIIYFEV